MRLYFCINILHSYMRIAPYLFVWQSPKSCQTYLWSPSRKGAKKFEHVLIIRRIIIKRLEPVETIMKDLVGRSSKHPLTFTGCDSRASSKFMPDNRLSGTVLHYRKINKNAFTFTTWKLICISFLPFYWVKLT